jgi:hypothetical protein
VELGQEAACVPPLREKGEKKGGGGHTAHKCRQFKACSVVRQLQSCTAGPTDDERTIDVGVKPYLRDSYRHSN